MTGIYIHFPFCIKKCNYCDFVSYENRLTEGERYVSALLLEMEEYRGEKADTVYLGGGTPTALSPQLLARVLHGVRDCFSLCPDAEITVEANPGTCDREAFLQLKEAGVNRISLGVQSFVDEELSLLGRIHSAKEAEEAAENVRKAGILNLSLDFMFSTPAQTRESLTYSLDTALALHPQHLSCYSLTLSEGTPLEKAVSRGELLLPDEEADRELYHFLTAYLEKRGYHRYEISNFAREGFMSRHNTKYWQREPYIGLGVAAHSFFRGCRYENPASLPAYYRRTEQGLRPAGVPVTPEDARAEFFFLGLRQTRCGVTRRDFFKCFGMPLEDCYGATVQKLCALGLLEDDGETLRLTERGIDVSNAVFCEFL
ncbi:MAG: radical SAM family heme chaperone HemW [Ruminococcaceae bacterium]|nr:radical SAM family heme chaperone HemW [Oscillospiraceae bacterium]